MKGLRAGCLAALSALLTATGHVAGGGALPDVSLLVVLLPLLAGAFVGVAERASGPLGTVAVLGGGQLALHLVLTALHPMPAAGAAMLPLHAVATLVTAAAVRHADAASAALAAAWRWIVPRRLVPPDADRPLPARPVPAHHLTARRARALTAAAPRRGPPVPAPAPSPWPRSRIRSTAVTAPAPAPSP